MQYFAKKVIFVVA